MIKTCGIVKWPKVYFSKNGGPCRCDGRYIFVTGVTPSEYDAYCEPSALINIIFHF